MKILNKISNIALDILIGIFAIAIILFIFGIRGYVVLSGSMEPQMPVGSLTFINQNSKFSDVSEQDIIAFTKSSTTITHRIVKKTESGLITRGDANDSDDGGQVVESNYIGKVIFTIPIIGYVVKFIQSLPGIISLVVLFVLLAFFSLKKTEGNKKSPAKGAHDKE